MTHDPDFYDQDPPAEPCGKTQVAHPAHVWQDGRPPRKHYCEGLGADGSLWEDEADRLADAGAFE